MSRDALAHLSDAELQVLLQTADSETHRVRIRLELSKRADRRPRNRAVPYVPGVPAAGHISRGYWHPGPIGGCSKCV